MKRQWDLIQKSPLRALLASFLGLPLIMLVMSLFMWTGPSLKGWFGVFQASTILGVMIAAAIHLNKRAPHLEFSGALAISFQVVVSFLIIWLPIAATIGMIEPKSAAVSIWIPLSLGILGLSVAWGLITDKWWAYFLQVAVVLGVVGLTLFMPTEPKPPKPEQYPGQNLFWLFGYAVLFLSGMRFLLIRGIKRWRKWRIAQLQTPIID